MLMKTHLNAKNLFLDLNIWAISVIRYSAAFLEWTNEKIKNLIVGLKNRYLLADFIHPMLNTMKIYTKLNNGGQGVISVEECCVAELKRIAFYLVISEKEKN